MEGDFKERYTFLGFFEIIFSFLLTNFITLITFILFPVTLISTMHVVRELFFVRQTRYILLTYVKFAKKNFFKSFAVATPLILISTILLTSLFYYNQILETYGVSELVSGVLVLIQLFFTYIAVNVLLVNSIQMSINSKKEIGIIYRDSFLFVSLHPLRCFLAFISVFGVCTISAALLSMYSLLIVVPIGLSGYYVVLLPKFELMFDPATGYIAGSKK